MRIAFGNLPFFTRVLALLLACFSTAELSGAQQQAAHNGDGPRVIDFEKHRDKEGRVDYAGAINAYFSKGVTNQNNAVVQIFAQIDPLSYDPEYIKMAWERLGADPPEQPGTWLAWRDELDRLGIENEAERDKLSPSFDDGMVRPWAREDFPQLAAWLDRMAKPLEEIEQATHLPHGWMPLVGEPGTTVDYHMLPHLIVSRGLAKCLRFRVGLAIQEERFDDAIRDIATMRRLALYLRPSSLELEQLVGISIHRISHWCVAAISSPGLLNTQQLAQLFEVFQATRASKLYMQLAFDTGHRAIALESFERILESDQSEKPVFHPDTLSEEDAGKLLPIFHLAFNHPGFNATLARTTINKNFDDCWRITGTESYEDFQTMSDLYSKAFNIVDQLNPDVLVHGALDNLEPMDEKASKSYTLSVTYRLLQMVMPNFVCSRTERQVEALEEICALTIKVAQYRDKHGQHPKNLQLLHAGEIKDPFDQERNLVYQQNGRSFSIYSIGRNLKDDGGLDDTKDGDLVIRVE